MPRNSSTTTNPDILSSWKEIANYLRAGIRTVQRYERLHGLPVRRPAGKLRASVIATRAEIDAWLAASPIRTNFRLSSAPANSWYRKQLQTMLINMSEMQELRENMRALRSETRSALASLRQGIDKIGKALPPARVEGYEPLVNMIELELDRAKVEKKSAPQAARDNRWRLPAHPRARASSSRCRPRQNASRWRASACFSGSTQKFSLAPMVSRASPNSALLTSTNSAPAARQSSSPNSSGKNRFSGASSSVPRVTPSAKDVARSSSPEDSA